jgi:DNA-directed RNA polymerase specialized sigma24 family protein
LDASAPFDDISTCERDMLVRYCARFTGDAFVAEDLAQQTLLEAWRKSETLYSRQVRRALGRRADLGHHVG